MLLLTPEKVRADKKEGDLEAQHRTIGLAQEESRIVRSLNLTRTAAAEETIRIEAELAMTEGQLETRKEVLIEEVTVLERRRKAALEPVDELKKKAEEALDSNLKVATSLEVREKELKQGFENLAEERNALQVRTSALELKELDLDKRELKIAGGETELLESARKLGEQKAEHAAGLVERERKVEEREANVQADARFNHQVRLDQDAREERQNAKDKEIADKYEQMRRTALELGITI